MARSRFDLESLESRKHLSVVLDAHGTLRVNADWAFDPQVTSSIAVERAGDQIQIRIKDGAAQQFANASVQRIIIRGGSLPDTIIVTGVSQQTWCYGGDAPDTIVTGAERDVIYGGAGGELIDAGGGSNYVVGGDGSDHITTGAGRDRIWGREGNDTITSGGGADIAIGGRGDDVIETGAGNDRAYGRDGNDTLRGGDGNDRLFGGPGNDSLEGNAGDDVLGGILGANAMLGGDGKDTFVVTALDGNTPNDFVTGTDVLRNVDRNHEDQGAD
jgi:Ca2+-binding RTX toxin-like protein